MTLPNRKAGEYAIKKSNQLEKLIMVKDEKLLTFVRIAAYVIYHNKYIIDNKIDEEFLL